MEAFLQEFQHLKIQLEAIESAIGSFDNGKVIGHGGFGKVYEGTMSHSKGRSIVAIKRLDRKFGQGDPEFLKEILMLCSYAHENLISLLGFCDEGREKILVYEHAARGSLDLHLSASSLTWRQRLRLCLGAATGLCYLHNPTGAQQRVIHRDIKSSNILLDENWIAKIADMGLSKMGPANQPHSLLATGVVGTPGYIDPAYMETYSLTKESDVYSFGVVLFEVLCGKLCFERKNGGVQILVPKWKQSYEEKKRDEIILQEVKEHVDPSSLATFAEIAYQCLLDSRADRPKMSQVVEKLQIALWFQEDIEDVEPLMDYQEISETAVPPLVYASNKELMMLLSKGILVNGGNTWFSLNENGEHHEMISAAESFIPTSGTSSDFAYRSSNKSRFAANYRCSKFKMHVRTQFLSPHITYVISLVFNIDPKSKDYIGLKYISAGETEPWTSYLADEREGGWFIAELYHFTSNRRNVNLEITFDSETPLIIEGIKFQPLDRVGNQVLEDEELDKQTISYLDIHWDQTFSTSVEEMSRWGLGGVQWTTKRELYSLLCRGLLFDNGEQRLSFGKNGKICHTLSASKVLSKGQWRWKSSPESRFGNVAFDPHKNIWIMCATAMLSPKTRYGIYLVYKLQEKFLGFEPPVKVIDARSTKKDHSWHIYIHSPQTPIIRPKVHQNTHNPLNRHKTKRLPETRSDGWMEVRVWDFRSGTGIESDMKDFQLAPSDDKLLKGIIVQGIVFRPR